MNSLKMTGLILGGFVLLSIFVRMGLPSADEAAHVTVVRDSTVDRIADRRSSKHKFIPRLTPGEVYTKLEKKELPTAMDLSDDHGNFWTNSGKIQDIEYRVETYSSDVSKVESIRATAIITLGVHEIEDLTPFLQYVASIPYKRDDPDNVQHWIEKNINNNHETMSEHGMTFEIIASSVTTRMLLITPEYHNGRLMTAN